MWRRLDEIPSLLFPMSRSAGTVRPMIGPAMYQGQGFDKNSIALNVGGCSDHGENLVDILAGVTQPGYLILPAELPFFLHPVVKRAFGDTVDPGGDECQVECALRVVIGIDLAQGVVE